MKSEMPASAVVQEITADEYKKEIEVMAFDLFYQVEEKLRMLGDSGGGRALGRLIGAIYANVPLKFNDLMPLDAANRSIALALIKEYLDGSRSLDEWESLAELADRCGR